MTQLYSFYRNWGQKCQQPLSVMITRNDHIVRMCGSVACVPITTQKTECCRTCWNYFSIKPNCFENKYGSLCHNVLSTTCSSGSLWIVSWTLDWRTWSTLSCTPPWPFCWEASQQQNPHSHLWQYKQGTQKYVKSGFLLISSPNEL